MENKRGFIMRNGTCIGMDVQRVYTSTPVGVIQAFSGTTIPRGFLLCNGASYKTTDYPELFDIIGYTYGGSDGTFNVPNLCDGRFLEGSDTSGEYVEAGLPNIEGEWGWQMNTGVVAHDNTLSGAFTRSGNLKNYGMANAVQSNTENLKFDASLSNAIYGNSDTVQPKSLRVLYIIKAFHTNEGTDSKNEVSDPIIDYVEGEIAEVENKIKGSVTHSFNTQDGKVKYLKLKLNANTISIVDIYGGKIEILGANNSVANPDYKTVKVVRHSYGNWSSYDATQVPSVVSTKIGNLYYYPTDNYYYLQLNNYANFTVTGATTIPELVASLPVATSEMTLIPESKFVSKDDLLAQTANRQVKTFDNTGSSAEKWCKICSAITGGIGCNIKLTASRADSTATVQYFSALFRDNRYRYTSSYISRERTVYESMLVAEYSAYIVADANNDIWVHVPSYGKAIIEIDTRAITIDGTVGTPVKDYVYSSFENQTIKDKFDRINIKQFNQPGSNTSFKYVTITSTGSGLGGLELNVPYAGKYMFSTPKSEPVYFGSSTHKGYTLNGWAWSDDGKTLHLRVAGFAPFSISVLGSVPNDINANNVVTISDMTSAVPEGVTFVSSPVYSNATTNDIGIKQVFYATSVSYPAIFTIHSKSTTGVFWFKHTRIDVYGLKSVEGYYDIKNSNIIILNQVGADLEIPLSCSVYADENAKEYGVKITALWQYKEGHVAITEARPVTAIPYKITY